eukprot:TRINITY_DN30185_c0_g1_i1.p1 TRINITY_DN30185_c0_g1~~TRINITY_DN30185_c0_g1_i1.p1  ORF type:complete len:435 (+),score=106.59 TRINITY_DN30185_c0_g1_i1:56-1306(+)
MARIVLPDHEEDYDSDRETRGGMGDRRLSKVEDKRLRTALDIVRNSSQKELKEECLRNEWYTIDNEKERNILKDCVTDENFWDEVKELARKELESTPDVMGEEQFRAMFKEFDADGSGSIDSEELRKLLSVAMGMDCSKAEVEDLMNLVDTDGNAEIDESEFLEIMNAAKDQQQKTAGALVDKPLVVVNGPSQIPKDVAARVRSSSQFIADGNEGGVGVPPPRRVMRSPEPAERRRSSPSPTPEPSVNVQELTRKASLTMDKGESKRMLGKATVEEYKDMLKRKAQQTRAAFDEPKFTEPYETEKASSPAPEPEPARDQPESEAARAASPSSSNASPTRLMPSGRPWARSAAAAVPAKEPENEYELKETRVEGTCAPPPIKKPRAYSSTSASGGRGVPSYMRTTQSSKPGRGGKKK